MARLVDPIARTAQELSVEKRPIARSSASAEGFAQNRDDLARLDFAHSWKERKGNRAVEISVGDRKPPLGVARLSPPIGHLMERPVVDRSANPSFREERDHIITTDGSLGSNSNWK